MRLAVIPARGGSKRIPRKNIKSFCGQPMLSYSIKAAQDSNVFDDIIVSTDDPEIAALAEKLGASVPFMRPESLSDDFVGTRPVTNHAIETYRDRIAPVTYCCCIYATAPFIQPNYLREGYQALLDAPEKAFAFSVTSFAFPIQRALRLVQHPDQTMGVSVMYPDSINKRSQDLEEGFHDAGQFYWGTAEGYASSKGMFSEHSIPIVLPRHLVQDIDTQEDWHRAELMYQAYINR
ncbi:pseudaminic acid cytidylyltransferase [Alteromonas oceanisediminis]|uniref:pseudaminic acid cytidylyltransferase n=1 Tax=Alteromonas oceanisediminis TaxID=2836180 RepID=UPI001BD998DB|nr:pseudaminic acid cytidylyltransferase [Alteromonas oceanisediminis]MBT0584952.1 pseudaminic acid cytidylyltransferase [Alteromonas oceanisediminis]